MKLLRFRANEKGLTLDYSVDPAIPLYVGGDPGRLRQVLLNLVGNALKFTEDGGLRIEAALKEHSVESGLLVHFTVVDTGIGISPETRDVIFDPFTQADGSTTRRFGGTGLGLAISSQLVKLMGGRMWVTDGVWTAEAAPFTSLSISPPRRPRRRPDRWALDQSRAA